MSSRRAGGESRVALALLAIVLATGMTGDLPRRLGKVFLTKEEALALAFPECDVTRRSIPLNADEKARVKKLGGEKLDKSLVFRYDAAKQGESVGTAYFDAHRVRTLGETIMVVVDPQQRIKRIEILTFSEPLDYLPRAKWYAQFVGKKLDDKLSLKREIKGVTGATLTARATTNAARKLLALHQVLEEKAERARREAEKKKAKKAVGKSPR